MHTADAGGETAGKINADGTAHLTGPSESYDLLSSQGTTLNLREVNGDCNFLTTFVLQQALPPLGGGAVVPQATATSAPATSAPPTRASVAAPTAVVVAPGATSSTEEGGRSLAWLWVALGALGLVAVGGGVLVLRCQCRAARTGARVAVRRVGDCDEERRRVERARQKAQAIWDLPELQGALGSPPASLLDAMQELDDALADLADCLGEDVSTILFGEAPFVRTQDLLGHFGFGPLVFPGFGALGNPPLYVPPDVPPDVPPGAAPPDVPPEAPPDVRPAPPTPREDGEIG